MSSFDSDDDNDIEEENQIQKFLLGDKPQKRKIEVMVGKNARLLRGEKTAINCYFWKVFVNYFPKLMRFLVIKELMMILLKQQYQMLKTYRINNRKVSEEVEFFSGGNGCGNQLKFNGIPST